MRSFFTLFVLSLFVKFAFGQQIKSYEITGNVRNIPSHVVYMNTLKRTASDQPIWPVIDSARISNGRFVFRRDTILPEPSWSTNIFYIDSLTRKNTGLSFYDPYHTKHKFGSFILENSKMQIAGDVSDARGLTLTGLPETDVLNRYGLLYPNLYKMNDTIDSLKKAGNKEALSKALSFKNDSLISFKKNLGALAKQHPSSWMMMVNVYQNADLFTPSELAELTAIFTPDVLNTPKGKRLSVFNKQSKNVQSGAGFPAFLYKDVNQKNVSLNLAKGKKGTIVIFWASWCGPCRAEIPELKKLYQEYQNRGINLVSISVDHDIDAWKKALKAEKMPWQNLANLPGDKNDIYKKYNLNAIPAIFLLDSKNAIVMPNEYRIPILREHLQKMLGGN